METNPRVGGGGGRRNTPESAGTHAPQMAGGRPHSVSGLERIRMESEGPPLRGKPCDGGAPSGRNRVSDRVCDGDDLIGRWG